METEIYFRPPKEGLPGVPEGALIKAEKNRFGPRVAPRLWYTKSKSVLEDAGWRQLATLPSVFVLRSTSEHRLIGLLILHVDDAVIWNPT